MTHESEIYRVFDAAGFDKREIKKTTEFRSRANEGYIYLDRVRVPSCIHLYIEYALPDPGVPGTRVLGKQFRSNCTRFPSEVNRGKTPCHYGKGVEIDNSASLSDFLKWFNATMFGVNVTQSA